MTLPKISVFTPTHNPEHLREAYDSLLLQNYSDFEWVIVPNGSALKWKLPAYMQSDTRIRVMPFYSDSANIGAIKRFACDQCKGDAFAEYDHDDLLVPGILGDVASALTEGAGFVYSDSAVFEHGTGGLATWGYAPEYGWEQYPVKVYDKTFTATRCFSISPRMLCEVYYAPDHIRVWSRKAYYAAGGHNPSQAVGDDHDLMCRTYLSGAVFKHTGNCGYLYRMHDCNTIRLRSAAIQQQIALNRRTHLVALVEEWCRREKRPILNLQLEFKTGQFDPLDPGAFFNDRNDHYGQIMASDVLQYVPGEKQVAFFNGAYRALVPGGYLHVAVPSAESGLWADMNPLHRTRFNRNSFLFYTRRELAANLPNVDCRFDLIECSEFIPGKDMAEVERFKQHKMVALRADMAALKGQRHPGPNRI